MANNVLAGYFNENELQHSKKMLTKNFRLLLIITGRRGGGFSGQLSSEAPFSVPMVHRQNNDNNFFPLLKGKVSLESGYPLAASFGILTSGNTNFPQIAIHAKQTLMLTIKYGYLMLQPENFAHRAGLLLQKFY
ncbi:hypothetical protein [Salmonella enterica]|uniref:hypothetical protein n=1 Tax=Salmonella enterica TaxID=28901 RepID=UPI0021001EE4|nr:hypothetical protein [Salmonella enterica]